MHAKRSPRSSPKNTHGIVVYGPHALGGPATFELRALMLGAENAEDPVTGSTAVAILLSEQGTRPGERYTVRQGTALDRDGRVSVRYEDADAAGTVWIGDDLVTVVDGTFFLLNNDLAELFAVRRDARISRAAPLPCSRSLQNNQAREHRRYAPHLLEVLAR